MEWYYAEDGQQRGPINETDFNNLVRAGTIKDDTLIWREGMANWQSYTEVRGGAAATATAVGAVLCSQCGKSFAQDQVIRYGDAWVCATCKPLFVQRLKEGAAMPLAMEYAGFWTRFGAKFLDGIILWVVNMAIGFLAGMAIGASDSPNAKLVLQLFLMFVSIVLNLGYGIFFLGKFGATLGKMACKIKVVTAEGRPITFGRATGRCFAEILSGLICYIGYIMAGFDEEKRALHDRICNTRVVKV